MTAVANYEDENVFRWTTTDVENWLKKCGLDRFVRLFCEDHEINGEALLMLTEKDLQNPPLQLTKLGDIKKLSSCLKNLQHKQRKISNDGSYNTKEFNHHILDPMPSPITSQTLDNSFMQTSGSDHTTLFLPPSDKEFPYPNEGENILYGRGKRGVVFRPEYKKTILSMVYGTVIMFMHTFAVVVVHDRVPDKTKHPPLPDIFLDNIPLIPQAFILAEVCLVILLAIWACILIFHKHRCIIIRRMYCIISLVYFLRCITMFVTSLSVPSAHLQCSAAQYSTLYARIKRAYELFTGFGLSLNGLHTCGDYIFSGHATILTMLTLLITKYSPVRSYVLQISSWIICLFGLFLILAGHEHYTIDVIIAFCVTSRLFQHYHISANMRSGQHGKTITILFPFFSYFECNVPGEVPNEFEWPFPMLYKRFKAICATTSRRHIY